MTLTEELTIARKRNANLVARLQTSVSLHANTAKKAKYLGKGMDTLEGKIKTLEDTLHRERQEHLMREVELSNATDMLDQMQDNFNVMAGMKMGELLDGVMIER
jgi:hypothetical protein